MLRLRQTAGRSTGGRPLLLKACSAGDAFANTPHPDPSAHAYAVVRGKRARWAHHDPRPCLIPPDWSGGYTWIFGAQAGEAAPSALPPSERARGEATARRFLLAN